MPSTSCTNHVSPPRRGIRDDEPVTSGHTPDTVGAGRDGARLELVLRLLELSEQYPLPAMTDDQLVEITAALEAILLPR